jgi:hypothetical protein
LHGRNHLSFRGFLRARPLDSYSIVAHENGSSLQRDNTPLSDVSPIGKVAKLPEAFLGLSVEKPFGGQ